MADPTNTTYTNKTISKPIMIITTRKQLLAAVPAHEHNGTPYFVRLSEIPEPWRTQMKKEVILCAQPAIEDERGLYYAWDFEDWVCGRWWGSAGPEGLA